MVNYRVFALCQADFSKGIAESQPSIQEQGPNAESLYDFWYWNFDCNYDCRDPGYSGLRLICDFWGDFSGFHPDFCLGNKVFII